MFSGIVEEVGKVVSREELGSNLRFGISCPFVTDLKIDQSIAHNGACLTVVKMDGMTYYVDVIDESRKRTNLDLLHAGHLVNLERSMKLNDRLDGHMVQGHVDQVAEVLSIRDENGSWTFTFRFKEKPRHVLVMKGSICVNGVSLTISGLEGNTFSVSVIPYTFQHTNFNALKTGDPVNIEFDVIGKYVERLMKS